MNLICLTSPLVALVAGWAALLVIRQIASAIEFVDKPDRRRKLHETPIPLGGGLAVWGATWLGWGAGILVTTQETSGMTGGISFFVALVLASATTLVLGVLDDRNGLRGGHKLAGQLIAAAILVGMGPKIDAIGGFGLSLELGLLSIPVTIFWILLVINAFNLIDGMDGFCGSVSLVASLSLALLAYWSGRSPEALMGLTIAGALVAFLKDNLPPAKIYLGDAGSMTLGLMISALSIRACSDGSNSAVSLPTLIALVSLPLLDVLAALGRRWLTGRSLFSPDRGHLHHRLLARLGSLPAALVAAIGLSAIGAIGSILANTTAVGDAAAGLALTVSVTLLVGTDTFGRSELRLLFLRIKMPLSRFVTKRSNYLGAVCHECHILGSRDWSRIWGDLVRDVEAANLRRVELAIDMPAAGETYHGLWASSIKSRGGLDWSVEHPIQVGGSQAGTMRIDGSMDESRQGYLDNVVKIVRDLEVRLQEEMARVPVSLPKEQIFRNVKMDPAAQSIYEASLI